VSALSAHGLVAMLLLFVLAACGKDHAASPPGADSTGPCGVADTSGFLPFDSPPEPTFSVAAEYPEVSREQGDEGVVQVLVTLSPAGLVCAARVQSTDASVELQAAAVDAALKWRFEPARLDGVAVPCRIVIPFRFSLG